MRKHYFIALMAMCSMMALLPVSLIAAGPPTVDVNVVNTPNVTVTNTPNVTVTNTPNVTVTNSLSSPIPIKNVENPAKTPFTVYASGSFPVYYINLILNMGTVPAGKRLVIEQVTAHCLMDSDDNIAGVSIAVTNEIGAGWTQTSVPLLVQKAGLNWDGKAAFTVSQQVRLYSDGVDPSGSELFMNIRHSKVASDGSCSGYVSGYFVDK